MSKVVMKRYDAYKDSGVEWLGEVPEHWEISHLKRFCTKITDGAHTSPDLSSNDYPFLTVVNLNNGILNFENCLFTSYTDYEKLVRNGCQPKKYDVLYSKDGTISETAVIDEDRNFVVGSSFIIVRPNLKMSNSFYLCYFLSSAIMRYQARIYVKGASLPRISIFNIAKLISIIPPLIEQQAIAAYLDTKTAQIDRKIDLLTQKATQYGKLKQSLINETVTRGLDKSVAMKDSGVEWIGEVPEHWGVSAITNITIKVSIKNHPKEELLSVYRDYGVIIKSTRDDNHNKAGQNLSSYKLVEPGFLVINKMKAWQGSLGVSEFRGIVSPAYITCETDKKIVERSYLHHLLRCRNYINEYNRLSYGVRIDQWDMRYDDFKYVPVLLPPMEEQKVIADYLDTKTAHINHIIETTNVQIEKLKELRKTLINDAVTGKIKVAQ